jgi:GntR family transcriptional regulator, phosphonate transport system regulatory protein
MLLDNFIVPGNDALMTKSRPKPHAEPAGEAPAASGVTLWRQIADDLERAIAVGALEAGQRLPGELALASRFGVNRHTVRRALAALAQQGLVRSARGSGTFVEGLRLTYPIKPRTRFSEIVGAAGREAGGRLIASGIEPASVDVAQRLELRRGAPVIRLDVLRDADRVPLCATSSFLSAERFAGAAEIFAATGSMTQTLARLGVPDYRRASTRVSAGIADAIVAMRLELPPGRPVLVVDAIDVLPGGDPILTNHARFAADRVELVFAD